MKITTGKKIASLVLSIFLLLFTISSFTSAAIIDNDSTVKLVNLNEITIKIKNKIPTEFFGGLYFDSNGNIVVNVTDTTKSNIRDIIKTISDTNKNVNITFNIVDKSLIELESVCEALIPFMKEYNIASLDADDVTNKIDIELYKEDSRIEDLVKQYIDLEYVNISILPENLHLH